MLLTNPSGVFKSDRFEVSVGLGMFSFLRFERAHVDDHIGLARKLQQFWRALAPSKDFLAAAVSAAVRAEDWGGSSFFITMLCTDVHHDVHVA